MTYVSLIWLIHVSLSPIYPVIQNDQRLKTVIPLFKGNPYMGIMTNSEDPDEMSHDAAFHLGLTLFAKAKTIFRDLIGNQVYSIISGGWESISIQSSH